jgi:hypothetical protein
MTTGRTWRTREAQVCFPSRGPVGNTSIIPSFSRRDPEGLQQSYTNKHPTQDWHTQSAAYSELGESIVIEPTHIKRAPHRTVPKHRGPRLSRQVKADLRYGREYLSPHMWFSDLKTLPPHIPPYLRSRHPGPHST